MNTAHNNRFWQAPSPLGYMLHHTTLIAILSTLTLIAPAASSLADAGTTNLPPIAVQITDDKIELNWAPGLDGMIYTLQRRNSIAVGSWEIAPGGWPIGETSWLDRIDPDRTWFYRIVGEPGVIEEHLPPLTLAELGDLDEDGLSDYHESLIGTDHTLADTDGDSLLDGYEVFLANDPRYAALETSPLSRDSNGDHVDDSIEVMTRVNGIPLPETGLTDSDMDGLTDRQELVLQTNPLAADTDGDLVNDIDELMSGSNPLNIDDMGDPAFYAQYGSPEEMYYLTDPELMGIGIDTLKETIGYIAPPPGGFGGSDGSGGGAPAGNPPIGSGDGGRDIYMVYIVTLESGERAGVVPKDVCPTGLIRLCPQILREEQVTLSNGQTITMTTIIPFNQIPLEVLQQCCVNDAAAVDPDSIMGRLAELFGDEITVLRTVSNYLLKHGIITFDEADRDRMFAMRLKFTRCCDLDPVTATALAMAVMVAVNADNIAADFVLQLLPGIPGTPFNIGDVISAADRALLGSALSDFAGGLINDDDVTQFICDLFMRYYCKGRVTPAPPGCPGLDDPTVPGTQTPGRPPGSGEADWDEPEDGNGRGESVGHSVPVDYGRDDPPANNPKGNKPPPGGAGNREAVEEGGGNEGGGIIGNKGGGRGGRKGIPPGGTPWGPIPVPFLIDDPPPTNFPSAIFELGDAPDLDLPTGYPAPNDSVLGRFPTVMGTANSRYGQPGAVILGPGYFWLGVRYSGELDAISGDQDIETNLNVPLQQANRDYYDDGLLLPVTVNPCGLTTLHVTLNSWADTPSGTVYLNVLIDFDRNGEWSGAMEGAEEWAVKNYPVTLTVGSEQVIALPPFQTPCEPFPAWVRVVASDLAIPIDLLDPEKGWDGSGWFNFGEVEDYFIEPKVD